MVLVFEPAFIQAFEHRAKPVVAEAGDIPLIDLAPLHRHDLHRQPLMPDLDALVAEVEATCKEWGFFHVVNHEVPPALVERAWEAARRFFALPPEERRDEVNPLGYYEAENTKGQFGLAELLSVL